jgi:hypothetical protein
VTPDPRGKDAILVFLRRTQMDLATLVDDDRTLCGVHDHGSGQSREYGVQGVVGDHVVTLRLHVTSEVLRDEGQPDTVTP